jgi:plasmid stabilization system protein ParE
VSHRLEFSLEALGDLIDLYDYIAQSDGAERAIGYIDRIEAEVPIKGTRQRLLPQSFAVSGT